MPTTHSDEPVSRAETGIIPCPGCTKPISSGRHLSLPHAQIPYQPCIPTKAVKVPNRPEWIHEVKHDGYRLIVQRDGKRVRLFTRNGHDWSERYPRIVEAALRNRNSSFVLMFPKKFLARRLAPRIAASFLRMRPPAIRTDPSPG